MKAKNLADLFEEELKDIYSAEEQLTEALPKMAGSATNPELARALKFHLQQTKRQIKRIENVMKILEISKTAHECKAMKGLVREGDKLIKNVEKGVALDCAIIAASQKIEHYEIASYWTLCEWADTLGYEEVSEILGESLNEEKETDELLSNFAETKFNERALLAAE